MAWVSQMLVKSSITELHPQLFFFFFCLLFWNRNLITFPNWPWSCDDLCHQQQQAGLVLWMGGLQHYRSNYFNYSLQVFQQAPFGKFSLLHTYSIKINLGLLSNRFVYPFYCYPSIHMCICVINFRLSVQISTVKCVHSYYCAVWSWSICRTSPSFQMEALKPLDLRLAPYLFQLRTITILF